MALTELESRLLLLAALSIRVSRPACSLYQGDTWYLRKVISGLKSTGVIRVSSKRPWCYSLGKPGVELLGSSYPDYCDFYLRYSNNHHPGSTPAHIQAQLKASELVAMCQCIGIRVGPNKPSRMDISTHKVQRLSSRESVLFLMKELKFEQEQKISRAQISRASGILLSRGLNALVYNTKNNLIGLNRAAETGTNLQALALRNEMFSGPVLRRIDRSIVLCDSFDVCKSLFQPEEVKKDNKRKSLFDGVRDRTITRTDFCFIPLTSFGIVILRLMTLYNQDEIRSILFSKEELAAGAKSRQCEALVKGLRCFEMVTMNMSKLYRVINTYGPDLSSVGFVCAEEQVDTLKQICNQKKLNLRIYKTSALRQLAFE